MYTVRIDIEDCDLYLITDADNLFGFVYGIKKLISESSGEPVVAKGKFGLHTDTGYLIGVIDKDKIYIDYTTKHEVDMDKLIDYCEKQTEGHLVYAELTERGVPVTSIEDTALELFTLLDNIDTISDISKGDNVLYRGLVTQEVAKRFKYATTDGQEVEWL